MASPTPAPSATSISGPSPAAEVTPAPHTVFQGLPLQRSAWSDNSPGIGLTPGPNGTIAVSITRNKGAVLAVYDAKGKPRSGWPIDVPQSTWCDVVGFGTDGSLRVVCDAADLPSAADGLKDQRAFAFDPAGRPLKGWPVQVPEGYATRVAGDDLVLLVERPAGDGEWDGADPNEVISRSWLLRVTAGGTVTTSTVVEETANECWGVAWALGPDGIAYGASESSVPAGACLSSAFERTLSSVGPARLHALDMTGRKPGWPISIDGAVSEVSFAADGTILVAVGSYAKPVTRLLAIDPGSRRTTATSNPLPVESATLSLDTDACSAGPSTPIVAADGTVFYEEPGGFWALGTDLRRLTGWPTTSSGYPVTPMPPDWGGGLCPGSVGPAVSGNGTLYLSLEPASPQRGGALDAIAKNGKRPAGWPVQLSRAGSKFWDVAVGEDGTVYALAVEPEGKKGASATMLAIDPDSDIRYAVTLLEP